MGLAKLPHPGPCDCMLRSGNNKTMLSTLNTDQNFKRQSKDHSLRTPPTGPHGNMQVVAAADINVYITAVASFKPSQAFTGDLLRDWPTSSPVYAKIMSRIMTLLDII